MLPQRKTHENQPQTDVRVNSLKAWVLAARPKTLSGASVPVMIGVALAWSDHVATTDYDMPFSWVAAVLCFLFAFIMQIDANFVNDLFDYLKGSDNSRTRLGPKRACAEGWVTIPAMKFAVAITTVVACMVGLPLVIYGGVEMIAVGLACVVFCFLYTTALASRGLGDLLVLVFFGIVPVCITYYVQTGCITATVFIASVACGLVIDTLLLINNFRDRDVDRAVNKSTLVVRIGAKNTLRLYLACGIIACLANIIFIFSGHWLSVLLPLAYLWLHVKTHSHIRKIYCGKALNKCLGETARNIFLYGLTVGVGLLL